MRKSCILQCVCILLVVALARAAQSDVASSFASSAVNWASLNETTLSSLPTSDFTSISSTDLGSIPVAACAGFREDQIAAVSAYAWTGLKAAQLGNIPANAFVGFSKSAISNIPDWSQTNATQIAKLSAAACGGFASDNFPTIPANAFQGFSAEQVANFGEYTACSSIDAAQMSQLTPVAFSGWKKTCFVRVPASAFVSVPADSIAQLSTAACNSFTSEQMTALNVNAYPGFTPACIASLKASYSSDACAGFSQAGFAKITPVAFAAITKSCIRVSEPTSWKYVTQEQTAELNATNCGGFSSAIMAALSVGGYSGLSSSCVSALSAQYSVDGCAGISAAGFAALSPASFSGFTSACVNLIPAATWKQVQSDQMKQMSPLGCKGLSSQAMGAMSTQGYSGLTAECISSLPFQYSIDGCAGLSSSGVAAITPESFSGFKSGCIKSSPDNAWSNVSDIQISSLTPAACAGFGAVAMTMMRPLGYKGFQAACIAKFAYQYSIDGCAGLSSAGVAMIQSDQMIGFTRQCIQSAPFSAFTAVNAQQMAGLNPASCLGFSSSQMSKMNAPAYAGFSASCIGNFSSQYSIDGCPGLSSAGVSFIQPQSFSGFTSRCIRAAPSAAFSLVSAEQIAQLSPPACNGFSSDQMTLLNTTGYAGFTNACVAKFDSTYSTSGCNGIASGGLTQIVPESFAGFQANCISKFGSSQMSVVSVAQIQALPTAACYGLRYMRAMQPAVFTAMTLAQITSVGAYSIQSMAASQILELVNRWGNELLLQPNGWSQLQLSAPTVTQVLSIKNFVTSGTLKTFVPLPADWNQFASNITWLHFALFNALPTNGWDQNIIIALNRTGESVNMGGRSFAGMRVDQVKSLTANGAAALRANQMGWFVNDTIAQFSKDQWLALSSSAISGITENGWQNVTCTDCISSLAPSQLTSVSDFSIIPCPLIGAIQESQVTQMTQQGFNSLQTSRNSCGFDQLVKPPGFVQPPVRAPSSSNNTPSGDGPGAPIGAIIGGVIGGIIVISGVAGFLYWRSSQRRGYAQL